MSYLFTHLCKLVQVHWCVTDCTLFLFKHLPSLDPSDHHTPGTIVGTWFADGPQCNFQAACNPAGPECPFACHHGMGRPHHKNRDGRIEPLEAFLGRGGHGQNIRQQSSPDALMHVTSSQWSGQGWLEISLWSTWNPQQRRAYLIILFDLVMYLVFLVWRWPRSLLKLWSTLWLRRLPHNTLDLVIASTWVEGGCCIWVGAHYSYLLLNSKLFWSCAHSQTGCSVFKISSGYGSLGSQNKFLTHNHSNYGWVSNRLHSIAVCRPELLTSLRTNNPLLATLKPAKYITTHHTPH